MINRVKPGTVDLVCLPEMIFTGTSFLCSIAGPILKRPVSPGYVWPDADAITPYLEDPETGPTSRFCADLSKRLHCYVVAGYPEALGADEPRSVIIMENYEHEEVGANSAVMYDPDGTRVGNYRKTNPFETDKTWAKPG